MKPHYLKILLLATILFITTQGCFAQSNSDAKELYELRTYTMKTGGNTAKLAAYLQEVLSPTLKRKGIRHTALFKELGNSDPTKLWFLIAYPDANTYITTQELHKDEQYLKDASSYNAMKIDEKLYDRIESMLLLAFDGLAKMDAIKSDSGLFELRTYESYSEDANRRKIKMFNVEELDLFYEVGLHPVFFGDQISGANRPCLTYMIQFKDMKEHDENWQKFIKSPKWTKMAAKAEYANTATTIHKIFLTPY